MISATRMARASLTVMVSVCAVLMVVWFVGVEKMRISGWSRMELTTVRHYGSGVSK